MLEQKRKTDCGAADLKTQLNCNAVSENLQAKSGYDIPPYRLAALSKYTNNFLKQFESMGRWEITYIEIEYVLETLLDMVRRARKGSEG